MLYIESDEALYYINNNKNDNDYKNKSEILQIKVLLYVVFLNDKFIINILNIGFKYYLYLSIFIHVKDFYFKIGNSSSSLFVNTTNNTRKKWTNFH